ncbi:MAG: hypothetical protein F9K30_05850 [Dechloromonas sp.]|nr:MAG: hypothetical protein F9K30_05850 [Dechloromonas sp.]
MDRQSNPFHARMAFGQAPQSLLGKVLTFILGVAFLILAFMFSIVALAVVAVGGSLFAGWLWWKTRALRKAMREAAPTAARRDEQVIEGEFVREVVDNDRLLR